MSKGSVMNSLARAPNTRMSVTVMCLAERIADSRVRFSVKSSQLSGWPQWDADSQRHTFDETMSSGCYLWQRTWALTTIRSRSSAKKKRSVEMTGTSLRAASWLKKVSSDTTARQDIFVLRVRVPSLQVHDPDLGAHRQRPGRLDILVQLVGLG